MSIEEQNKIIADIHIYVLKHPDTNEVRYVGKAKSIKKRFNGHLDYAIYNRKRRKVSDWILSLLKHNKRPVIESIEVTTEEMWPAREIFWIAHFRGGWA